tara:strand:+ start:504 stop:875 length:372 start_codon:yes stop_codon:yes gene_type:complete
MEPTETEIACFESGIKLGSLYHQFIGSPISENNINSLATAIENSIKNQPYCSDVSVIIDEKKVDSSIDGMFGYTELKGDMMSVTVGIEYENTKVIAKIREENGYPLMFIESIDKTNDTAERNG